MQNTKLIAKIEKQILKNAALLKQGDLMISARASLDVSESRIRPVKALYKGVSEKKVWCQYSDRMPFHALPNASVYKDVKASHNWIAALFGNAERKENQGREVLNWKNGEVNRYMRYMFNRLGHLRDRGNSKEYWRVATHLLTNKGFQWMALNHVCPNFMTHQTENETKRIMTTLGEIISEKSLDIPMRRVYIEKSNGKWRPLGVPAVAWRVYLHMWNCLIVWFREGKDRNHAYFPRRGIHTAWEELLPKLEEAENVYEFDLESFFPSVDITEIEKIMVEKLEIPSPIAHYLMEMHRSITKIPSDPKMAEESDLTALLTPSNKVNPNLRPDLRDKVTSALKLKGNARTEALESILPKGWTLYRTNGVPQGTATSCGIATISLFYVWQLLGEKLVMYADDGILFPSDPEEIKQLRDVGRGIRPNEEKSGWAKSAGQWTRSKVKFLGLEYSPATAESEARLRSKTRNGSDLEYSLAAQLLTYLKREWSLVLEKRTGTIDDRVHQASVLGPYSRKSIIKPTERTAVSPDIEAIPDQPIKDWLVKKIGEFTKLPANQKLGMLFSKWGLKALSEMYNGRWGSDSYEKVSKYVKGSWLHIHGGRFQHSEISENWPEQLTLLYYRRIYRETVEGNLPEHPDQIWDTDWWEGLSGKTLARCMKVKTEMEEMRDTMSKHSETEVFSSTLNSLFKWNTQIEKGAIDWKLRNCMRKLLRDFPFETTSLSSMAISDYLSKGFVSDRKIRYCTALKTGGTLVSRIPRDREPKKASSLGRMKDFKRDFHIDLRKLVPVLDIDVGLLQVT